MCPFHRLAVGKAVSQEIGHLLVWRGAQYGSRAEPLYYSYPVRPAIATVLRCHPSPA